MITQQSLLTFFHEQLAISTDDIGEDTLLFSNGIIDSFALISLMSYLEKEGGFRMRPTDVNLDNLDSVSRIVKYVQSVHG
jgi:acyl carrier protein